MTLLNFNDYDPSDCDCPTCGASSSNFYCSSCEAAAWDARRLARQAWAEKHPAASRIVDAASRALDSTLSVVETMAAVGMLVFFVLLPISVFGIILYAIYRFVTLN